MKAIWAVVLVAVIAIVAYMYLSRKDGRSVDDRLNDVQETMPLGADKAAEQLGDRTPMEKTGNAIEKGANTVSEAAKETGDDIKADLDKMKADNAAKAKADEAAKAKAKASQ